MTAEQALDQYKNFNENVKGIYRKSQFTGAESAIKISMVSLIPN
jgi:hypothetical protein